MLKLSPQGLPFIPLPLLEARAPSPGVNARIAGACDHLLLVSGRGLPGAGEVAGGALRWREETGVAIVGGAAAWPPRGAADRMTEAAVCKGPGPMTGEG